MQYLIVAGCIACLTGYLLTLAVSRLALRVGFVDRPDGHHKKHESAVALGGGLAVFLSVVLVSLGAMLVISPKHVLQLVEFKASYMGGLFVASLWIVVLGLVDDRFGMRGRNKLIGQLIAVSILVAWGLRIDAISLFGQHVPFGIFAIPITIIWLLGAINSLNLLDGIDGLASTIGIVLCITIATMAMMTGQAQEPVAFIAALMAGSLLGFLRFNFPPAVIYLGDTGSMLIGLVVGALAIGGSLKGPATVGLAAPLAIWALPIFDSFAAIVRRKYTGRSIYATDRGHLHHCLMAMFGSNSRVLGVVGCLLRHHLRWGVAEPLHEERPVGPRRCGVGDRHSDRHAGLRLRRTSDAPEPRQIDGIFLAKPDAKNGCPTVDVSTARLAPMGFALAVADRVCREVAVDGDQAGHQCGRPAGRLSRFVASIDQE